MIDSEENSQKEKKDDETLCSRTANSKKFIAIAALIILLIVCVTTVIIIAILESNHNEEICYTLGCIKTASSVLKKIDFSVDPCDDFYDFACGNFIKSEVIPPDKEAIHIFETTSDEITQQIKEIMLDDSDEEKIRPFKLAKMFYNSCMNKSAIEQLGLDPINKIGHELGGFPLLQADYWNDYTWNLEETIIKLRNLGLGYNHLFSIQVTSDDKNSSRYMISLDQPCMMRKFLVDGLKNEHVQKYFKFIIDISVLFGADRQKAEWELKNTLDFEISLAKITLEGDDRRNLTLLYNLATLHEVNLKYRYINWIKIFNRILTKPLKSYENINVVVPKYFEDLGTLLNETPKSTIANFIMLKTYGAAIPYLTENLIERHFQFYSEMSGSTERSPRWEECLSMTQNEFGIAISSMYIKKYFPRSSKKVAMFIVEEIRKAFKSILLSADWMDEETSKLALLKLEKMIVNVGYPEELMDDKKIIKEYINYEVDEDFYFDTSRKLNKIYIDTLFDLLGTDNSKLDWRKTAFATYPMAFYEPNENSINLAAAILQGDFFSADRPNYMNYGAIGYVIGHEITHGFDNLGSQYNWKGNLENWWKSDTKDAYLEKTKSIIDQYNNYEDKVTSSNINGNLTRDENIADNGGIKESYLAYNNWVNSNGREPKLPGLQNFTANQMFWISAAQIWCSKERYEVTKIKLSMNPHSPPRFRVLGPLQNSKDFSEDFKCRKGSNMNPDEKNEVW